MTIIGMYRFLAALWCTFKSIYFHSWDKAVFHIQWIWCWRFKDNSSISRAMQNINIRLTQYYYWMQW